MTDDGHGRPGRFRVGSDDEVKEAVAFGQALTRLRRAPWPRLLDMAPLDGAAAGLEAGELDTLDAIARFRDATMTELASRLQVTPSTATRAVERLVKRGLAERYRPGGSGRSVHVRPTTTGVSVYWELTNRRVEFILRVLDELDPAERQALVTVMPKVAEISIRRLNAVPPPTSVDGDGEAPLRA